MPSQCALHVEIGLAYKLLLWEHPLNGPWLQGPRS